ncbi:hypothetical protein PVAND_007910 [Polypedilum vanderplanki]|uniref:G protein pathway suppressor 2 n=1 Tax=Polypedilum vanderplanki TaxID=319348 RepID=A0A9J6C851_POLVA|nr:hypothetical protein PVAND_007910 [Polypedilum vanderplanki]
MSAKKYMKIQQEELDAKKEEEKDKLWMALKRHIMRERERKKQLELETAKEEQLRSEVLARKKQDNAKTLGKTKEEIQQVEEQMVELKNKKHQLFLQLKALITKEVEMEKIRKESEIVNIRNDVGMNYQPYSNEKGVKRPHSPMTQADYYNKHGQAQRLYLPPKTDANITGNRLWYKPATQGYGSQGHQQTAQAWPTISNVPNNRYTLQQTVPAPPHPILIPHEPPQLVKQQAPSVAPSSQQPKTNSISIEKITAPQQADFTLHRRLLSAVPPPPTSKTQGQTFYAPTGIVYPEYITQNRDFSSK